MLYYATKGNVRYTIKEEELNLYTRQGYKIVPAESFIPKVEEPKMVEKPKEEPKIVEEKVEIVKEEIITPIISEYENNDEEIFVNNVKEAPKKKKVKATK